LAASGEWFNAIAAVTGEGGYYGNLGEWEAGLAPRLVYGYSYSCRRSSQAFSYSNRPSQNTMAFTAEEKQDVTLFYGGIDPSAAYRDRFALVRPEYLPRFTEQIEEAYGFDLHPEKSQTIYADGQVLATNVKLPIHEAELVEFDIPKESIADGRLVIAFEKSAGVGEGPRSWIEVWRNANGGGTHVSEAWLMKKDRG